MQNDENHRANPDALLRAVIAEGERSNRGKLYIFLGMCAGAGKTYAMLEAAQHIITEGADIVIGVVETHGRIETAKLTEGIEQIPLRTIDYGGTTLHELDLDALLARRPKIALVDELAHTNAPGSRHTKRYQDIGELLDAGISVYTTLNVQHLESRADAVAQITGITIKETVPDSLLDEADDIRLIDISPEELLKRLAEGKVYTPERSAAALRNFFREGNLTALREMALRSAAEHSDKRVVEYMRLRGIRGPWKSGQRLLVAVSHSPYSAPLIRWTRRFAYSTDAPWLAVHVETSKLLDANDLARLNSNMTLARELGAEVISVADDDVVQGILRAAYDHNVTEIVAGKPSKTGLFARLTGQGFIDRLLLESGTIDVHVVRAENTDEANVEGASSGVVLPDFHSDPRQYGVTLAIVAGVAALLFAFQGVITPQAVGIVLLFTVLLLGLRFGRGPVLLSAATSALLWNFLFIRPYYTLYIASVEDVLLLVMYFAIALVSGSLTTRIRRQQKILAVRERRSEAQYRLAHTLSAATTRPAIVAAAVRHLRLIFEVEVRLYLAGESGEITAYPAGSNEDSEKELTVARWVFSQRRPAGKFTATLPAAKAMYLPLDMPLAINEAALGVVAVYFTSQPLPDQLSLLESFVQQITLALDRERLKETTQKLQIDEESEKLYSTLLNSISHELRTPLAVITAAAGALNDAPTAETSSTYASEILEATERLNRLVGNLLDMTRLESGRLRINAEWHDPSDIIGGAIMKLRRETAGHTLRLHIPDTIPLVKVDGILVEQALINILRNAALHTPVGTIIELRTSIMEGNSWVIEIEDNGGGIPPETLPYLFEKFYRIPNSSAGGVGLGLSITRGFIEAHAGTITAGNTGEGLQFRIVIPVETTGSAPVIIE